MAAAPAPAGMSGGFWKATGASYLAAFAEGLATILVLRWALGALGPERYGAWVAMAAAVAWVGLADLGMGFALVNAGATAAATGDERALARLHATATAWLSGAGLVLGVGAVALARRADLAAWLGAPAALRGELSDAAVIVAVLAAVRLPLSGAAALATGAGGLHRVRAFQAAGALLQIAGAWAGARLGLGTAGFAAVVMGGQVLGPLLAAADLARREGWARARPSDVSRERLASLVRPSLDFFLLQISTLLILNTDNLVIALTLGAGAVPAYAVPFRLALMPASVLTVLTGAAWPSLAALHARGEQAALRDGWTAMVRVTGALALGASLVVGLFGGDLARLWVGEAVAIPAGVGALVAAYAFLFVVENGSAVLLNATGRTRGLVRWGLGGAALNLALSLALVRPLGVAGVALGTLLAALATTTWYVPWAAGRALALGPADLWRALPARWLAPGAVTLALGLSASGVIEGTGPRCAAAAALGLLHLGLAWRFTLEPAERARTIGWIRSSIRGTAGGPA